VWLVNVKEDVDSAWEFIAEAGLSLPVLLDEDGRYYEGYATEAALTPYPLHIVVDRSGDIVYINREYDADLLRDAIRAALDAE